MDLSARIREGMGRIHTMLSQTPSPHTRRQSNSVSGSPGASYLHNLYSKCRVLGLLSSEGIGSIVFMLESFVESHARCGLIPILIQ